MKKILITILIITMIGGIILATREIVKGHCGNSKCTYDVYTKEKVDELLSNEINKVNDTLKLKKETMQLTFNYVLKANYKEVKTGTITVPVTFYKDGAMVSLEEIELGIQYTGLAEPVVTTKTNGNPKCEFYVNSGETPTGVTLTYSEVDKFKKYVPLGKSKIFNHTVNSGSDTFLYSIYADVKKDVLELLYTSREAGSLTIETPTYMSNNTY